MRRQFGWASLSALALPLGQFIALVVLARLLTPEEFGAAAIVSTVTAFATLLMTSGIAAYVVHVADLTEPRLAAASFINVCASVALALSTLVFADPLASALGSPQVADLIRLSSLGFAMSVGASSLGVLERETRFRAISIVDLVAVLLGQATSIALAIAGFGATSLVVGAILVLVVQNLAYIALSGARRNFRYNALSRGAVADVWKYTREILAFNVINYWSRNLDNVVIARVSGLDQLGFYSRAYSLMLLPVTLISGVVGRVLLPTLARQQHRIDWATRTWIDYAVLCTVIGAPVAAVFIVAPGMVVEIILGPQWVDSASLLLILAISIAPQLITRSSGALFQALGKTRALLIVGLISTVISMAAIITGALLAGVQGVAVGVSAAYFAHLLVLGVYINIALRVKATDLLLPVAGACLTTFGAVLAAFVAYQFLSSMDPLFAAFILFSLSSIVALALCRVILPKQFRVLVGKGPSNDVDEP